MIDDINDRYFSNRVCSIEKEKQQKHVQSKKSWSLGHVKVQNKFQHDICDMKFNKSILKS